MADRSSGCCGICSRIILVCVNLFYLVLGIALSGFGILLTIYHKYLDSLTQEDYTLPSIGLMIAGLVVLIMSIVGIIGAATGNWCLLLYYSFYIVGLVGLLMAGGVWLINHNSRIENNMNKSFHNMIMNYSSDDSTSYNPTTNAVVDFIQDTFECCGDKSPMDWLSNYQYIIKNGPPSSCMCNEDTDDPDEDSKCLTLKVFKTQISLLVWKTGCNETLYGTFNNIINGIGITFVSLSSFTVFIFCLSCGVCLCSVCGRRRQRRVYHFETTAAATPSAPPPQYGSTDDVNQFLIN